MKTNFFLHLFSLSKILQKYCPKKLDIFTKLKQIFRKLKDFQDKRKKFCEKLKVSPTRVGLACGKMSNKKACQVFFVWTVTNTQFKLVMFLTVFWDFCAYHGTLTALFLCTSGSNVQGTESWDSGLGILSLKFFPFHLCVCGPYHWFICNHAICGFHLLVISGFFWTFPK